MPTQPVYQISVCSWAPLASADLQHLLLQIFALFGAKISVWGEFKTHLKGTEPVRA